jgi:hypothetical protein
LKITAVGFQGFAEKFSELVINFFLQCVQTGKTRKPKHSHKNMEINGNNKQTQVSKKHIL